ncbi:hypothetical protein CXF71_16110 [Colwellia sp. 12G3]|nr:PAS domain-containing protein [Colwellia sp. 12G3]PKI14102.1 hypothetical protein CXF71_16110 [Colwellia sp. 12G3]
MLCVLNKARYFQTVNPSFSRALGYKEEELLTTPIIDFINPDDVDRTMNRIGYKVSYPNIFNILLNRLILNRPLLNRPILVVNIHVLYLSLYPKASKN